VEEVDHQAASVAECLQVEAKDRARRETPMQEIKIIDKLKE
jgi:hypothetical protein